MLNSILHKFQYGKNTVTIETGMIARQATSAVMASIDDTSVLVTVVGKKTVKQEKNYFPLMVNYQERTYAAGRIPGGFFRREGRPSENEILIARLIDRPIRPLFPEDFFDEVQIIATVVSVNPQINPDIVAIIGTSAALSISGLPFKGPIGAARVGMYKKKYLLNPTVDDMKSSVLDLVVSGDEESVLMVEAEAKVISEKKILSAIQFGHEQQQNLIQNIRNWSQKVKFSDWEQNKKKVKNNLYTKVCNLAKASIKNAYKIPDKKKRLSTLDKIKERLIDELNIKEVMFDDQNYEMSRFKLDEIMLSISKEIVRKRILKGKNRIDGRKIHEIRKLNIQTGILSRTHGSALFTRGETQALVSVTLGTARDAQNLDELLGDRTDNFLFHYNFPPYSVGEIGLVGSPKRREIGHGKLAKKSLVAVMPKIEDFPYTIRVVSEITESNGSSSMASVCGASLALMDAGVPIKFAIAGIAMGLIKDGEKYSIISDILGDEDHLGDMDFKVAGSKNGITSLQMDIKIRGITKDIIKQSLLEAKKARLHLLNVMEKSLNIPRNDISEFAPRIYTMKINPGKIKDIIGKGGSVIRMLTEETGTSIEIEDTGVIKISSTIQEKAENAIKRIQAITAEIKVGKVYLGKVTRIVDFGAFVSIGIGKEGLVHISQISSRRVEKVEDYLQVNQEIFVKVLDSDRQGRLRLSLKEVKKNNNF